MKYTNIVFDLFGTLVELEEAKRKGIELKNSISEDIYEVFNKEWSLWHKNDYPLETFLNNIRSTTNASDEIMDLIRWRVTFDKITPYPDVLPSLSELKTKGYKLHILTNSPPTAKRLFFASEVSSYFDESFWSFELGTLKPDREIFAYMHNNLKCEKEDILYIGDSYKEDYLGGMGYGLKSLWINRLNPEGREDEISSLLEVLDKAK